MRIKGIVDEDFVNYKKPSMFVIFPTCTFKCNKDAGKPVCQNQTLSLQQSITVATEEVCERYLQNPITEAIILGGLEPFDSLLNVMSFIDCLRNKFKCDDDVVIYTGYTEEELKRGNILEGGANKVFADLYDYLIHHNKNIIIKYGRYREDNVRHLDKVLGVELASANQYAVKYGVDDEI